MRKEGIYVIDFNISKPARQVIFEVGGEGGGRRMDSKLKRYANEERELIDQSNRVDGCESRYWIQIDE